jgi:hypothetical protein
MPSRTRKGTHKRTRKQRGKGPVGDWIKKAAKDVHSFVKDKKLISRGLSALASSGLTPYSSGLSRASSVASTLGYGKKRHTRKSHTKKSHTRKKHTRKRTRRTTK